MELEFDVARRLNSHGVTGVVKIVCELGGRWSLLEYSGVANDSVGIDAANSIEVWNSHPANHWNSVSILIELLFIDFVSRLIHPPLLKECGVDGHVQLTWTNVDKWISHDTASAFTSSVMW